MKIKSSLTVLLFALGCSPVLAQDSVFLNGSSQVDGQVVHSYSNAGAMQYHKVMRVNRDGAIANLIPPPQLQYRANKPIYLNGAKDLYSFEDSAFQKLPVRWLTYFNWDLAGRTWTPAQVELSGIIATQAKAEGIDPLLVEIVIKHESNFEPRAVSHSGARGLMQLMPATAATLGCADAFDPIQNVAAGTHYLAEQYRRFGDLQLMLAAYNAGPGAVESCGGIPPIEETQNYVSSISSEYQMRRKKKVAVASRD